MSAQKTGDEREWAAIPIEGKRAPTAFDVWLGALSSP
jgi:hypothetical protein